ncbi:kinase-like domain-containing protein [Flagelloscypha sp. PMI_526]|nr:kinase-like domain-containing protein [Flagelloscypha sp. PMI_526]
MSSSLSKPPIKIDRNRGLGEKRRRTPDPADDADERPSKKANTSTDVEEGEVDDVPSTSSSSAPSAPFTNGSGPSIPLPKKPKMSFPFTHKEKGASNGQGNSNVLDSYAAKVRDNKEQRTRKGDDGKGVYERSKELDEKFGQDPSSSSRRRDHRNDPRDRRGGDSYQGSSWRPGESHRQRDRRDHYRDYRHRSPRARHRYRSPSPPLEYQFSPPRHFNLDSLNDSRHGRNYSSVGYDSYRPGDHDRRRDRDEERYRPVSPPSSYRLKSPTIQPPKTPPGLPPPPPNDPPPPPPPDDQPQPPSAQPSSDAAPEPSSKPRIAFALPAKPQTVPMAPARDILTQPPSMHLQSNQPTPSKQWTAPWNQQQQQQPQPPSGPAQPSQWNAPPQPAPAPPPEGFRTDGPPPQVPFLPRKVVKIRSKEEESKAYGGRTFTGVGSMDDYELLTKVGEGTFGEVHKALHKLSGDMVALKRILMHNEKDGMPITALREIKILKALKHPNILEVRDMIVTRSTEKEPLSVYMVSTYMDHDLAGLLENERVKLMPSQIKLYMQQLMYGMAHMHANKILHRDLKAANLLISNNGTLKIADFGLARAWDGHKNAISSRWVGYIRREKQRSSQNSEKMLTNCVVTRWYRPPELLLGAREYGGEVDMWGIGCVLAEMFMRKPIFMGSTDAEQLDKIFEQCGTPTSLEWPGWDELPQDATGGNGGVKKHLWGPAGSSHGYPRRIKNIYSALGIETVDLLDKLLLLNPNKRITAKEALDHAYFWTDPLPADPATLQTYEASHEFDKRGAQIMQARQHQQNQAQQQQQQPPRRGNVANNMAHPGMMQQRGGPPMQGPGRGGGPPMRGGGGGGDGPPTGPHAFHNGVSGPSNGFMGGPGGPPGGPMMNNGGFPPPGFSGPGSGNAPNFNNWRGGGRGRGGPGPHFHQNGMGRGGGMGMGTGTGGPIPTGPAANRPPGLPMKPSTGPPPTAPRGPGRGAGGSGATSSFKMSW